MPCGLRASRSNDPRISGGRPSSSRHDRPAAAVEEPEHHRFPVQRRHGGDPEIELARLEPHPDPPVLRLAPLRDVQLGQQLDPRDDRGLKAFRRTGQLGEHAVDPEPDPEAVSGRLQVDVARAGVVGLANEQVDETDHRRLAREIPHVGERVVAPVARQCGVAAEVPHQLDHRLRRRERSPDRVEQLLLRHLHQLHGHPIGVAQVVDRLRIRVAGDGDPDAIVRQLEGEHAVVLEVLRREGLGDRKLGCERSSHGGTGW